MKGPLLVLSVCTAGLRRRRLCGLLPQLSWGKHRRRNHSCRLQTPGRAGCHQVDKVSHFARRQDYSQGQRLKWLLFELQSPKHSHTARRRERHMHTSPAPMPIPFRIHCLRRDHSIAAAEHTRRQQAPCERQNGRRYSRVLLLYTKLLFEEMQCQLCYDTASAEDMTYLNLFLFDELFCFSDSFDCSSINEGQWRSMKGQWSFLSKQLWVWFGAKNKVGSYVLIVFKLRLRHLKI